ncbi:SDR family NAD(P)-dependent oxidoreductase [Actinosynnema sp. NPDC047251]|uniref:Putative short chain dehydrogenase n=1 Tax=Saccharothrix espanaensis (strain ATCC 51144 / DSM 44229 / JCM 9112 / NBRC 15066 / NRRL 15764) TaxID=1179773 RepID=K0K300_SACES|nr:SDR family NAD(P)-dependent oxidoreductase [Saccharothrix espanaensis]CCH30948.1 putative short chain dehydrogenase [Saccharothrix espanaensis DSM 44229]
MSTSKTAVVIGVGPGLGMSVAHRFGREGHAVALISRTTTRHAGYVAELAAAGVRAEAFAADTRDRAGLLTTLDTVIERFGGVDVVYYGPGAADLDQPLTPITDIGAADVRTAMDWLYPAVDVVERLLPAMLARGSGSLLFAGGLSAVLPMPPLGAMALTAAALRNYALTLHAALSDQGVYAGTLTIGGLIERGDIHRAALADPARFGPAVARALDPDDLAEALWRLHVDRDRAEEVVNAFT